MIDNCPLCGFSEMNAVTSKQTLKVKGVDITSDYKVFQCSNCKQEFTTDEIDEINIDNFKKNLLQPKTPVMNLPNLERILSNPNKDSQQKAIDIMDNAKREQQLKQAIEDAVAKSVITHKDGWETDMYSTNARPEQNIERAMQDVSILRHCDPEIMKKSGWIRQEDYQKAIDGLKKCMDNPDFPRSFAQAALIDLKEL